MRSGSAETSSDGIPPALTGRTAISGGGANSACSASYAARSCGMSAPPAASSVSGS